jgi:hypothetical protein
MTINDKTLKEFREDFIKLNHALELKYGVALSLGNLKYTNSEFKGTLTALVSNNTSELGEPEEFEKLEFERLAWKFGFKKEDYRKDVLVQGRPFKIVGFKEKARKNKYIIEDINGQKWTSSIIDK